MAASLGAPPPTAAAIAYAALRIHNELLARFPSFVAPGCYKGGPLDIHPYSPDWPF